ncbi:uncharacterized protein LOC120766210 [Bactrocera tryoni]|nr:uncharacterized protein LOC120766210 [Bactrocera tryoni]
MQNIKLIQPFDGDANYLALYVDSIDSIMPVVAPTQRAERAFYFNCILRTLRGAALDIIRREQPSDWSTLRELLIDEFGEHTPISTLILQIIPSSNTILGQNQSRQVNVGQPSQQNHCTHSLNSPITHTPGNALQTSSLQTRVSHPVGSNQSRIRRYGQPEPMDQDMSNFQLEASEDCHRLN